MNSGILIIGILAIVVIVGALAIWTNNGGGANTYTTTAASTLPGSQSKSVPILVTDPPAAPSGTQALIVTYSSVAVHTSGAANSGWVSASGSGSVDLMSAVNVSKIIGFANLTANSTINLVRLNITSATIKINGTVYNLTLPNSMLTIAVTGKTKISAGAAVLIDISPVISESFNQNTTAFAMAPAAKATIVTSASANAGTGIGSTVSIDASIKASLAASVPNITIASASVSTRNNVTTVSVTVKDNGNSSVVVNSVFVVGNQNITATQSAGVNSSLSSAINGVLGGGSASANARANLLARIGLNLHTFNMMSFVVTSGGSLALPLNNTSFQSSGSTIAAGSSATFSFSGKVSYDSGIFVARTTAGSPYKVTVIGNGGAWAATTVSGS